VDEQRQRQILDGLEEIFLREGFRRVTVGELAKRLRCSRRALYELAESKEGLFVLVVDRLLSRIRALGDAAAAAGSALPERIESYLAPGIEGVRLATHLFTEDLTTLPQASRIFEEHQRRRLAGLRGMVAEGARRGIVRGLDSHLVADILSIAYRRASEPDFLAETNLSMTEAYREIGQLLCHGLLHPAGRAVRIGRDRRRAPRKRSTVARNRRGRG
jgi:AcrR family transcriptional regulator